MASGSAARFDVSLGPAAGTPPGTRLLRVFEAFAREGPGGSFPGRRFRPARGRPRPLCTGGKRAADPPGDPLHRPVFEVRPGRNPLPRYVPDAAGGRALLDGNGTFVGYEISALFYNPLIACG